jgi:histidine kinase
MLKSIHAFRHMLAFKLILTVGLTLLFSISTWAYYNIRYQKQKVMKRMVSEAEKMSDAILLGTRYAMMLNSRIDINQIILNISKQKDLENIRIFNKDGQIKFSNNLDEIGKKSSIKEAACVACHRSDPPYERINLAERTRIFNASGHRKLGIVSPIFNEPGCFSNACHVHSTDKKVLGAFDMVLSLKEIDEIFQFEKGIITLAVFSFIITAAILFFFVFRFVNLPIRKLIKETQLIADGKIFKKLEIKQNDELGLLALAINQMGKEIQKKTMELNRQRDEYQNLFEQVPCLITVQDKSFKLVGYNREFSETFNPQPGDYCFYAYKGRNQKCNNCPVEKTFGDGESHLAEESGLNKDGSEAHWIVKTSPIRDAGGNIIAAMEMSIDITDRRLLEKELQKSEEKYQEIFNNIPNPAFVLDRTTLRIIDCNRSVQNVYGFGKDEILNKSFLDLFKDGDKERHAKAIQTSSVLNQVKQSTRSGLTIYVDIWISPSEYAGQKVFLVTTSDITQRLETEQQLIQASKMATLGEMATGVAHELNQPLSVIKTASSYFMRKLHNDQPIDGPILLTMAEEIDRHVRRATKIIGHMRQFGRKADANLERVQLNDILHQAFDFFYQQLTVRGIDVTWNLAPELPQIIGDAGRLEQVVINLLINSRDAIEERWPSSAQGQAAVKQIHLSTACLGDKVVLSVCDTGIGIAADIMPKIFEPFFTTKKVGQGTGLGLSISYGIIKECNGEIFARPNPDGGTCFVIEFPVPGGKQI